MGKDNLEMISLPSPRGVCIVLSEKISNILKNLEKPEYFFDNLLPHCYNTSAYVKRERNSLMKQRERRSSRLGFILLSAGCAIGCGNVWKFPWMAGQYGGGSFVLIYVFFLLLLGIPSMVI